MSASDCFEYGGYHFFPLRRFTEKDGDLYELSRRLEQDPVMGLTSDKDRQKFPYSYDEFYKASPNPNYDVFCCVENGKIYVPGDNYLFLYHNPNGYQKREQRILKNRLLIDTDNQHFDMQEIENRRFMYNPFTGILLLGAQYAASRKVYGSHAEDLANAGIYNGYDDYVRGWIGTGKEYPHGIIHFAPNVDAGNTAFFDRAFETLDMFSKNGAQSETVVRGFGKCWEQPLKDILQAGHEQKLSVHEQLQQKPEQHSDRPKQTMRNKEAVL